MRRIEICDGCKSEMRFNKKDNEWYCSCGRFYRDTYKLNSNSKQNYKGENKQD